MPSLLEFSNSSLFRKRLLTRNLTPYAKAPNRPSQPIDTPYVQTDSSVQDSPDQLIDEPSLANQLYPLNQYGAEGGYKQVPDPGSLLNTRSNEGEYGYQDANIVGQSVIEQQRWKPLNVYSNASQLQLDAAEFINSLDTPIVYNTTSNNQPYPTTFVPSSFGPASILLFRDPQGSNGFLSQDSFIQRLGAETLRREFQERIATQIRQDTLGRVNILNATSGTDLVNIISGQVPALEPNYTITVALNPVIAATNLALRLAGSVLPVSPIPGSYFDPNINPRNSTTLQQLGNAFRRSAVGSFINNLLGGTQTGSQIMFNNMGVGQKSRLFFNVDYNKFKPNFPRNIFDRIAGAVTGTQTNNSNFYIGSITSEPSRVFSPSGSLPNDAFGREIQAPVYGPSELAQLYEGPNREIRLGSNGPTYSNGGGIEGGLTWVSPKYRGNAGKKVGINGEVTNQDEDFRPSSYNTTESTNITFREGSILDETQRLINSQPDGGKRLQHVGNAIDQVSKVFNDGYTEMTKGSRVYKYVGAIGQEVGTEYCRVFAKDIPYLQYNDLQKTDGITTNGRRFSYSVLDNSYNLNIVPNKQEGGQSSTNLIGTQNNAVAKKYMFSLENLAWRTSSTPGFSVSDLAVCERGPNGGRVMWFPPYGLKFTESVTANWNQSDFLGRPEPIYTYKNTSRGGTLTWKIVVDHPSVLNLIVNKVLGDETNRTRVDSIIESFFAGCRKYDLYELAKKYYTINPNDLFQLQEAISSKKLSKEEIEFSKQTIQTGFNSPTGADTPTSQSTTNQIDVNQYQNLGFYFANDFPKRSQVTSYENQYNLYTGQTETYKKEANSSTTIPFFETVVTPNYEILQNLAIDLNKLIKQSSGGNITITVDSSCSAPATISYNKELSGRRIESVIEFFKTNPNTKEFFGTKLLVQPGTASGETAESSVERYKKVDGKFVTQGKTTDPPINCTDRDGRAQGGDTTAVSKEVFTVNAMACRRAFIKNIKNNLTSVEVPPSEVTPQYTEVLVGNKVTKTVTTQQLERAWKPRDNITKRILRLLLSECDYFETIKADTPMVFDNLKDKLKYFHPAFHSMTPEGLNTRLTFLQQCMRPGDSIPTIKQFGETQQLQYNNATNTSFGAPPVLVLRIGDFYNTKIIPNSLSIDFEELDLNPEGIGVQPMIANIQMNFNFVGGSGLKESIDKLQNALTFNFYANTEIYDDRADVTADEEFLKVLDKEFLSQAQPPGAPALNQAAPNNGQNNNSTIGSIITSSIQDEIETGRIEYGNYIDSFVKSTQTYFQNVVNKNKETVNQYNNAVRQQWMIERNYFDGNINVTPSKYVLFGKPNNVEKRFNEIFEDLEKDISDSEDPFIKFMSNRSLDFSKREIKTLKENYKNFVKNKRGSFQNALTVITQDFVNIQQIYIRELSRINTILFSATGGTGTDGFQNPKGDVKVYSISGTTEVETAGITDTRLELIEDIKKIQESMNKFNEVIQTEQTFDYPGDSKKYSAILAFEMNSGSYTNRQGQYIDLERKSVFIPFSKNDNFTDNSFRRQYMILSSDVVDTNKYNTFKQAIIGNIPNNNALVDNGNLNISDAFDRYWLQTAKPAFEEENTITKSFLDNMEKDKLKEFLIFTPFSKKKRIFTFTSQPVPDEARKTTQENMIKGLANTNNIGPDKFSWNEPPANSNGEDSTKGYISKAKLN